MSCFRLRRVPQTLLCLLAMLAYPLAAQQPGAGGQYPASLLSGLHWRDVGPMRGGRSYAVAGNVSQPTTFYMGSVGGGVWKTVNAGRTWFPSPTKAFPSALSAPSTLRPRIRASFTWARASLIFAASIPTASACTNQSMKARRGSISVSITPNILAGSRSTPRIPIACTSRFLATPTILTLSAASIAQSTVAPTGGRSSSKRQTPTM